MTLIMLRDFAPVIAVWGQTFEIRDLFVVALLVVLEGVLSIDNALVLGLLAKRLPKSLQRRALSYGLIGAFAFRFLAIGMATFLLQWSLAKFLGGAYLVYISVKHLLFENHEDNGEPATVDEPAATGSSEHALGVTAAAAKPERPERLTKEVWRNFWWTVFVIEMTDIAFAVDSILAAIGVVGHAPKGTPEGAVHPKLWVVITGGFLGLVVMRFAAVLFIKLLDRFPRFETSAYLLVAVIGLKLLADWAFNSDWSGYGWTANQQWTEYYMEWLRAYWFWPPHVDPEHPPHLLDFHDLRRPEAIVFWLAMIGTFSLGFLPNRRRGRSGSTETA